MGAPYNPEFPGLFWQTDSYGWAEYGSDLLQYVGGNDETDVTGNKVLHVGRETTYLYDGAVQAKWDGIYNKTHAGLVSDIFIGGKHSMLIGGQITTNVAIYYEKSLSKTFKTVAGTISVDSQVETKIIGGGGKADFSRHVLNAQQNLNRCGTSLISIMKDSDIYITSDGGDVIVRSKGGNIEIIAKADLEISCKKLKIDADEVDFGKAKLNKGKIGTIFTG
jgi:hypothetical protein